MRSCTERNRSNEPTAWRLIPGHNSFLYAGDDAMFMRRASFLKAHLWVTPFNPNENFPGGDYPNQSNRVGDGLEFYTSGDRSLEDAGLVLWHVFTMTHLPRLEDWPVMPCEKVGFTLQVRRDGLREGRLHSPGKSASSAAVVSFFCKSATAA